MDSWWDFCGTFWKGPGWCPGGGRLGDASQVAEVPVLSARRLPQNLT